MGLDAGEWFHIYDIHSTGLFFEGKLKAVWGFGGWVMGSAEGREMSALCLSKNAQGRSEVLAGRRRSRKLCSVGTANRVSRIATCNQEEEMQDGYLLFYQSQ